METFDPNMGNVLKILLIPQNIVMDLNNVMLTCKALNVDHRRNPMFFLVKHLVQGDAL